MSKTAGPTTEVPDLIELGRLCKVGQTLDDLWFHPELLYFFVWKDIKVKYKQIALGVTRAILQPLHSLVLFTILFGGVAALPSAGLPYRSGAILAIVFTLAVHRTSGCVVMGRAILFVNGELILHWALRDVYADFGRVAMHKVGFTANWEFGNDTGSRLEGFEAHV